MSLHRIQSRCDQLGQRQAGSQARRLDAQQGNQAGHPVYALVLDDEIPGRFPGPDSLGRTPA